MIHKITIALIAAFSIVASTAAEARHHHRHYRHIDRIAPTVATGCVSDNNGHQTCGGSFQRTASLSIESRGEVIGGRPSGCPHAFCGCGVSLHIFGRIIPELNLASNWGRHFPSASPGPGKVAWRNHHVFAIESFPDANGNVVAYDPNSGGHRTRVHLVSLRGFKVVDPHGARVAGL